MTVTKELIDKIVNGENSVASDEVIDLLYAKASEALDSYKKEYAGQLMNPTTEEEPEVGEGDPNIDAPQPEGSAEQEIEEPTTEPEPEEEQ
mgnify:FL=1|jgi:hypothetical protein|tara:strand:- start:1440 stop:1712 length:273 start_codon:yes stop_codon:yes gene_type:complete